MLTCRIATLAVATLVAAHAVAAPTPPPLANEIPASAVGALVVERSLLTSLRKLLDNNPGMRQDLSAYFGARIGFDPATIDGIVAWLEPGTPPRVFVLLRGVKPTGPLKLPSPIAAVATPTGILLSTSEALATPRAPAGPSKLQKLLTDAGPTEMTVALADFAWDRELDALAKQYQLDAARVIFRQQSMSAELFGNPQKLEAIGQIIVAGLAIAAQKLHDERERAFANPDATVDGVAAIIGYHQLAATQRELEPKVSGNRLSIEYKLPDLATLGPSSVSVAVAVIGIGAAVAIPSFVRYTQRAKVTEARWQVPKIATSAAAYYDQNKKLGARFRWPASTSWEPAQLCCPSGTACARGEFKDATWQKLDGAQGGALDRRQYQYRFTSTGVGKKATFRIEARGDLNCNGVFSRFWIDGSIGDDGSVNQTALQIENELE